jgi:nicotinate-nucleotide adenylyltransferase
VHFGHLRVALDVVEALGLERVHLVPLNVAVHREQPQAAGALRLAMLQVAVADEPRLVADGRELERAGGSYSVDTLRSFRAEFGPRRPLCLLLGGDAFNGFLGWHQPHEIAALAHLVVMQRPGYRLPEDPALQALVAQRRAATVADLAAAPAGRILFQPVTQLAVSASDIRARVAQGRSARYLTPAAVLALIAEHALYRSPPT